jgi:uncharacterized SAM-binding protein YcdF (DUF218 family)
MALLLGKLGWLLVRPSNLLLLLSLLGLLGGWAGFRRCRLVLGASLLSLAACILLPVGGWLVAPLEDRFPRPPALTGHVDGIVFLGGGIDGAVTRARGLPAFGDTMERFAAIPELARRFPDARLVFTGGTAWNDREAKVPEAAVVRRFLADQGMPEGRVLFEDRARSTRENALLARPLANPKPGERWLLVTSAGHMPRAVGAFRRTGWPGIVAWPVDYRTTGTFDLFALPLASQRLLEFDEAAYEWLGLLYYRLLGYSDTFFPGPGDG